MSPRLMIPGPVELEAEVLKWMGAPARAHYGEEWITVHNETIELLGRVYATTGKVFLLPGSGSLALDAAVHSAFSPGEQVVVGRNGFFGERLTEILVANGVVPVPVEAPPDKPLDPASFARTLDANPAVAGVAFVHLETSTAVLNPAQEIAQLARERGLVCLVDAVTSLGGTALQMDEWGIDLCVCASQKALGGPPGVGIVAVGSRGWEKIVGRKDAARSWYLDLRRWQWYVEQWGDWHPFPVTMPTAVVLGLRAALQSLMQEGLAARIQRYEALASRLREGLAALGMTLFVPPALMAPVLTAAYCPPGVTADQVVRYLLHRHQIQITVGFGPYRTRVVRIGHMGGAIDQAAIDGLLDALRQFMRQDRPQPT